MSMFKGPLLKMFQQRKMAEKLFLYTFDYQGEFTRFGYGADTSKYPFDGGINHSNDNIYVYPWPEFVSHLNEKDTIMAKTMVDFWTSFATTGVPTSSYCSNWPSFTSMTIIGDFALETQIGFFFELQPCTDHIFTSTRHVL